MSETYVIASIGGALVATLLFGACSIVIGVGVTTILRGLAAPAGTMSYLGTTPPVRRSLGVVTAAALLSLVWLWLWSGFYVVDFRADSLTLIYAMPRREHTVALSDIASVRWRTGHRFSHFLVLATRNGRELGSAQSSLRPRERDGVKQRLDEALVRARP